jgi:hypothetical protein
MRINQEHLSPTKILFFIWIAAVGMAFIATLPGIETKPGLRQPVFTGSGLIWIAACLISFFAGARLSQRFEFKLRTNPSLAKVDDTWRFSDVKFGMLASYSFIVVVYTYLMAWAILTIRDIGGLGTFVVSIYSDWYYVWRTWVANKPFPGARLLYTGLIAVSIFFSTQIGYYRNHEYKRSLLSFKIPLALALVPLIVLPLIVSRRVLLATAVFGSIVAYITIREDGLKLSYVYVPALILFGFWILQDVLVASVSEGFLLRGIHRILYYFSNDIGNVNRAVAHVTARSYGLNSFKFVTDYLFVTEYLYDLYLDELQRQASVYKPAGTWTLFGNPYVDFGWLGLLVIAGLGFVSRAVYQKSRESLLGAQVYGLTAAGLILSWHYSLFSTPEMVLNVVVLIMINKVGFIARSVIPSESNKET